MLRRTYNDKAEPKPAPKEEKSHWNDKVEVWTEPQKPKQEKIVKYEVDTGKLLDEIANENKKTIGEIADKFNAEPSREQNDETDPQKKDLLDKAEAETEPLEESEMPQEEPDPGTVAQEASADLEQANETESIEQMDPEEIEDNLDDPTFTDPAFWEQLESELSEELEQEEDLEAPPEEDCY
jgi:hypothetical protein